jgi:hypothetical protein
LGEVGSAMTCRSCGKRPALFIRRQKRYGKPAAIIIKSDSDHDLCPRCWRSMRDQQQALQLRDNQ